ncbi:hypothetical protein [Bosea sp. RAC05]|uniref:hypothetical protein n=1 Tax=Bosea sp. RAC05 TaxID=1842539 RepID=UPI00083DD32A|nr:hypothetical protein [Bosea sp. RAC05]AOG02932.1 hypothetical protein BSY19_4748 [Bosea sp. RAC05]
MNEAEHKLIQELSQVTDPLISAPAAPLGTLLYGYDTERRTWHVYLDDEILHLLVYRGGTKETTELVETSPSELHQLLGQDIRDKAYHVSGASLPASAIVPNKRLYPEACDFGFCRSLIQLGQYLSFTTFNPGRESILFHGWTASELKASAPERAPGM